LLQRCVNINAVKEFLTYLVFETYQLEENDFSYQLSRLGFFDTLNDSTVFKAMKVVEQKKLLKLMNWQFNRVKRMSDYICKHIELSKDKTVIDLGCGIGQLSYLLAERGLQVTAIDLDVSHSLVIQKRLKSKIDYAKNVVFKKGNALDLSDINRQFDLITLADVVEHITEKEKLFKEIDSKLNHGGAIAIHTDNLIKLELLQFVKRIIYLFTFRNPKGYNLAWSGGEGGHVGLDTPAGITKFMRNMNYTVKIEYDKDDFLSKLLPGIFANGFIVVAQKK
jgi:2-polyprenyl-3-methyl-5-hydroxy-6-metoxy-1,4-benzoquinol methylase